MSFWEEITQQKPVDLTEWQAEQNQTRPVLIGSLVNKFYLVFTTEFHEVSPEIARNIIVRAPIFKGVDQRPSLTRAGQVQND